MKLVTPNDSHVGRVEGIEIVELDCSDLREYGEALKPSEVIEAKIDRIGVLRNRVSSLAEGHVEQPPAGGARL